LPGFIAGSSNIEKNEDKNEVKNEPLIAEQFEIPPENTKSEEHKQSKKKKKRGWIKKIFGKGKKHKNNGNT
jgi:hypothetical protein